MIIEIPAPCAWVNSNQRLHPQAKAKLTRQWREAGRQAALNAPPFLCPVHIIATVHKPRGGRWDPGNWYGTAKAAVDGIVEANVLADDDWRHVVGPDMRRGEPGPERLVLTITPL